jgi:hypothetical protein
VGPGASAGDTGLPAYQAADGNFYLGSGYGVMVGSSDFTTWTLDEAAPHQLVYITGTGTSMFASTWGATYHTANESNPSAWSELPAVGEVPPASGRWMIYEEEHQILYSSAWGDEGHLYRMVTP